MTSYLQAEGLTKSFGERVLFENLSLDLTALATGYVNIGILSAFSTALIPMAIEHFNNLSFWPSAAIQARNADQYAIAVQGFAHFVRR